MPMDPRSPYGGTIALLPEPKRSNPLTAPAVGQTKLEVSAGAFYWRLGNEPNGSFIDPYIVNVEQARTIAISPDSLIDQCVVTPKNGPPLRITPEHPYPFGDWRGPFQVNRTRTFVNADASAGSWVASDPGRKSMDPYIGLYFVKDGDFLPRRRMRRMFALNFSSGPVNPAALARMTTIPFGGRQRVNVALTTSSDKDLEYRVNAIMDDDDYLIPGTTSIATYQIWPLGGGTRIIPLNTVEAFVIENENISRLEIFARFGAAGASTLASCNIELSDD